MIFKENAKDMKARDEVAVSIRDMVFVACGTVLIITGHLYFAIVAFVCAAFRFDLGGFVQYAKKLKEIAERAKAQNNAVDELVKRAHNAGLVDDAWVRNYEESVK